MDGPNAVKWRDHWAQRVSKTSPDKALHRDLRKHQYPSSALLWLPKNPWGCRRVAVQRLSTCHAFAGQFCYPRDAPEWCKNSALFLFFSNSYSRCYFACDLGSLSSSPKATLFSLNVAMVWIFWFCPHSGTTCFQ